MINYEFLPNVNIDILGASLSPSGNPNITALAVNQVRDQVKNAIARPSMTDSIKNSIASSLREFAMRNFLNLAARPMA